MNFFRYALFIYSLCVLTCGDAATDAPSDVATTYLDSQRQQRRLLGDPKIIPGVQLGPVHLDSTAAGLAQRFGEPIYDDATLGKKLRTFRVNGPGPPATLTIYEVREPGGGPAGQVRLIRSTAWYYRDGVGIGVGSSRREVARAYALRYSGSFTVDGDPCRLYSTARGIAFEFGADDRCRGVIIVPKDEHADQNYLPLYDNLELSGTAN